MSALSAKICIIGDFAVGKTSTVERFVNNQFSEKYLTTIGVKVDTKNIDVDGVDLKLIIWDVAGSDKVSALEFAYLRGASGYILVADGTRVATVSAAKSLRSQVEERFGDLPVVFLINKADLKVGWEVSEGDIAALRESFDSVFVTSAKTGKDVEEALTMLARQIFSREFGPA